MARKLTDEELGKRTRTMQRLRTCRFDRGLKSNGTKTYAKEKLATRTVYKIDL